MRKIVAIKKAVMGPAFLTLSLSALADDLSTFNEDDKLNLQY